MKFLLLCRLPAGVKAWGNGEVEDEVIWSSGLSDGGPTLIRGVRAFEWWGGEKGGENSLSSVS